MNLDNLQEGANPLLCYNSTSKSTISNPKNKGYELYKSKVKSSAEKKASEMFQDRAFGDEWQAVYNATIVLKIAFSIASACTVFIALFWVLKSLLGIAIGGGVALIVCLILEGLKGGVWDKLTKFALKYKSYPIILVAAAILFNLSSVGGSMLGAFMLPTMQEQATQPPVAQIDIDSINESYLAQTAKIDAIITEQSKQIANTTSNSTKRSISKVISVQTEQKNALIEQQNLAIEKAETINENRRVERLQQTVLDHQKQSKENTQTQIQCVAVAVFFELCLVLCSIFISFYLFRVDIDVTETVHTVTETVHTVTETAQMPTNSTLQQGHQAPQQTATATNQIGFKRYTDGIQPNIQSSITETVQTQLEYTRVCKLSECEKPYIHGHGQQKYCCTKCRKKADRIRRNSNK